MTTHQFAFLFSVTPCEGKPCRNSGECLENENGTFTCKCQINYDGLLCEKRGMMFLISNNECEIRM